MRLLEQIIQHNKEFIKSNSYTPAPSKIPAKHFAVFTCMDTRLVESLEWAMGIKCGDAKVIKNAGNSITGSFDSVIRSFLICIFELEVKEIAIIGHYDCGMATTTSDELINNMLARGISEDAIKVIEDDLRLWIDSYRDPVENVKNVVKKVRSNPLIPKDVPIHGLMFNQSTGELEIIINGYNE